jgi:hypothetical protein
MHAKLNIVVTQQAYYVNTDRSALSKRMNNQHTLAPISLVIYTFQVSTRELRSNQYFFSYNI